MARPREFDIDDAIAKAVEVFWLRGYDGAALPDLLNGMGIARGSLYKAFGDKKQLYLRVLQRYDEVAVAGAVELLTDPSEPDGAKRIARLFDTVIDVVREGDRKGCLMCNAAAGPASDDADIGRVVSRMLTRMTQAFAGAAGFPAGPGMAPRSSGSRGGKPDCVLCGFAHSCQGRRTGRPAASRCRCSRRQKPS